MDSLYPECCSEPDSTAKFPESKGLEWFRAWVNPEWFQASSAWAMNPWCQEPESRFPELEKPFPAVRFPAALCPGSESIPECWFPVPERSQFGCSPFRFRLFRNSCLRHQRRYQHQHLFRRQSEAMPS